jgi:hypothetical protein
MIKEMQKLRTTEIAGDEARRKAKAGRTRLLASTTEFYIVLSQNMGWRR